MVNLVDMEKIWKYISHMQKLIEIYRRDFGKSNKDLERKIKFIKAHIERKKESKIDLVETKEFLAKEWKKIINKAIKDLLETILSRKTRGSEFSIIKDQLNKIREDINIEEYDLDICERIYENDLGGLKEQTKEKLAIEDYHKKCRWMDRIIGFILGLIATASIWLLQISIS